MPKFRAWDKRRKEMWKVATLHIEDEYADLFKTNIYENPFNDPWAKFEDLILMQSTGLKDKNGVEIFEGDIVLADRAQVTVSFGEQKYEENYGDETYYIGFNVFTKMGYGMLIPVKYEVLGNIHANPELLRLGIE